jgi:hypothetical protein
MKKVILSFFTCLLLVSARANRSDSIPPNPADVGTMDGIVAALYNVISGPAGEKRNWDRMRTLFLSEARMMATGKRADGTITKRNMSIEDYINSSGPILERDGFFEQEISRKVDQFGNIVHLFSTYAAKRKKEDEKPFIRGVNSIQLWNDGKRWWIVSILWQAESPENPIPSKYLD